jgi:hypothetical protein
MGDYRAARAKFVGFNRTLTKLLASTIVRAMNGQTTICGICREIIR